MDADASLAVLDLINANGALFEELIESDIGPSDSDCLSSVEEQVLDAALLGGGSDLPDNDD